MENEIVMMGKFLELNSLLFKMVKRKNELNGKWSPKVDDFELVWEVFIDTIGNVECREASFGATIHPFYFKNKRIAFQFIAEMEDELSKYCDIIWEI